MDQAGVRGYEASIWNGILVPAGTPKAIELRNAPAPAAT
jgi:tripartite-type tricarboxylate transporter receptor subunit TctC